MLLLLLKEMALEVIRFCDMGMIIYHEINHVGRSPKDNVIDSQ